MLVGEGEVARDAVAAAAWLTTAGALLHAAVPMRTELGNAFAVVFAGLCMAVSGVDRLTDALPVGVRARRAWVLAVLAGVGAPWAAFCVGQRDYAFGWVAVALVVACAALFAGASAVGRRLASPGAFWMLVALALVVTPAPWTHRPRALDVAFAAPSAALLFTAVVVAVVSPKTSPRRGSLLGALGAGALVGVMYGWAGAWLRMDLAAMGPVPSHTIAATGLVPVLFGLGPRAVAVLLASDAEQATGVGGGDVPDVAGRLAP